MNNKSNPNVDLNRSTKKPTKTIRTTEKQPYFHCLYIDARSRKGVPFQRICYRTL